MVRASFDNTFAVASAMIHVSDCRHLERGEIRSLVQLLNAYGFVVLCYESEQDERQQLLGLRSLFGELTRHRRSEPDGIAPISPSTGFEGYSGTSAGSHPPHTDGSFDSTPPRFMALQCVTPAFEGGHTQLLSGLGIYRAVADQSLQALSALFAADALTVCRDSQMAQAPVFWMEDDLVQLRFRDDHTASFSSRSDATRGVELIRRYIADPMNVLAFRLERKQVLIVDNRGVLHGRTAFDPTGGRLLFRATFDGAPRTLLGLQSGFSAQFPSFSGG